MQYVFQVSTTPGAMRQPKVSWPIAAAGVAPASVNVAAATTQAATLARTERMRGRFMGRSILWSGESTLVTAILAGQ
ncbi:hypothetical protein GCM10009779_15010 [Polymorphospora rubra]|uniref:Uncharacterized protein n=1 Tax=Polymorphospora rubra TaxID=338584 RepID=A0A810MTP4_9ACTN|nr:hypothetical protein Prubr_14720 [Polymorphospora rubra]